LGSSLLFTANVTGGNSSTNRDAITWSASPATLGTLTGNGRTATFRGLEIGLTTITARHESGASDDVEITLQPPTVSFAGVYQGTGSTTIPNTDVKGSVRFRYQLGNAPDLSLFRVEYALDAGAYAACTQGADYYDCSLNTALLSAGRPLYFNGTKSLNVRVLTGSGQSVATGTQALTFNNQDYLNFTSNNPSGQTGLAWRGADLTFTGTPVRFSSSAPVDNLRFGLDVMRTSGAGSVVFNQAQVGPPFTMSINAGITDAEGAFRFTPKLFDLSGVDVTSSFGTLPTPITVGVDVLPPRINLTAVPPSTIAGSELSLKLTYATGPYAAGSTIALSRISNYSDVPAHPPFCAYRHLHGSISIQNADGSANPAVYADPEFTRSDPCGHGEILTAPKISFSFNISGSINDPWLFNASIRLYEARGACDGDLLVDDVPVAQGTGPGQSPTPMVDVTGSATNFSSSFSYFGNNQQAVNDLCLRVFAEDRNINSTGQPAPNRRGVSTNFSIRY
jgi:hypothetical protein